MRKDLEKKKNDLIRNIIFQNGELHGRIRSKNILIAERIKELYEIKNGMPCIHDQDRVQDEIDWLIKLADI